MLCGVYRNFFQTAAATNINSWDILCQKKGNLLKSIKQIYTFKIIFIHMYQKNLSMHSTITRHLPKRKGEEGTMTNLL